MGPSHSEKLIISQSSLNTSGIKSLQTFFDNLQKQYSQLFTTGEVQSLVLCKSDLHSPPIIGLVFLSDVWAEVGIRDQSSLAELREHLYKDKKTCCCYILHNNHCISSSQMQICKNGKGSLVILNLQWFTVMFIISFKAYMLCC